MRAGPKKIDLNSMLRLRLVAISRFYKRIFNPITFIARVFIDKVGDLLSDQVIQRSCLDIGAGICPYESILRNAVNVTEYIALDISPSDMTDVVADCVRLPFKSDAFDLVVSFDVIQHVPDANRMLNEVHRVLKPHQFLLLTYPFLYPECDAQDFRRWTVDGMRAMLNANGFVSVLDQRRGGLFFAVICLLTWSIQHALPGQRKSWRGDRNWGGIIRSGILMLLTLPTQLLGWIALGLDFIFQTKGLYMGACVLARKGDINPTSQRGHW